MRRNLPSIALLSLLLAAPAIAADLVERENLRALELQRFWTADAPVGKQDLVRRMKFVDDNIYLLTDDNTVFTIHAGTGILRWSRPVAPVGQTVRGPCHSKDYAAFTTPTSIRLFSRRNGSSVGEPRALRGVITEVAGDAATINLGELHGVQADSELDVVRAGEDLPAGQASPNRLRVVSVGERESRGRFVRLDQGNRPQAGDRVMADVSIPIVSIPVPFSPSSPVTADDKHVYFGAGNQRFYSLSIIGGFRAWELLTLRGVTASPLLIGNTLYIAGQNGLLIALDVRDRSEVWTFKTEGPLFAEPVVTQKAVFVASSDRSLYAVDIRNGKKLWRARFDNELLAAPVVAGDVVFQAVPRDGLYALNANTGEELYQVPDGLFFLTQIGDVAYVVTGMDDEAGRTVSLNALERIDLKTGKQRGIVALSGVDFAAGSMSPPSFVLADKLGHVLCARSMSDTRLKPAEIAEVLRNEDAAAAAKQVADRRATERTQRIQAARRAGKPADPFASRSTTPPAAGPGLVAPSAPKSEPAPTTQPAKDAKPTTAASEEPTDEDGEKAGDESADEKSDDDKPADEEGGGGE